LRTYPPPPLMSKALVACCTANTTPVKRIMAAPPHSEILSSSAAVMTLQLPRPNLDRWAPRRRGDATRSSGQSRMWRRCGRTRLACCLRVTEDNLALDVRGRPGRTAVRMALSPRSLIRMKSEVQVLPGTLPATTSGERRWSQAQADSSGVQRMTPHNWHNFLRCHGRADEHDLIGALSLWPFADTSKEVAVALDEPEFLPTAGMARSRRPRSTYSTVHVDRYVG
jgi:hypothetical protein